MGEPNQTTSRDGANHDSPEGGAAELDEPPSTPQPAPHSVPAPELARLLATDPQRGLTAAEAAARLERDGPNQVATSKGTSAWQILLRQVSNSLTVVLVAVMGLSFVIHDYIEAAVIAVVILFNIIVG
jgi:magnesium-transporting ATPase (P-type)